MSEEALISYLHNANIKDFSTIELKDIMGIQEYFKLSYRQVTRMLNKYGIISETRRHELNKVSSKENPDELIEAFKSFGYDPSLILPLKESYIPLRFKASIIENIKYQRITRKKGNLSIRTFKNAKYT
ncbi:hypothetical protein RCO48_08720 [Peribacillus frigoritolerans]|nr:hypothetical protein [Peribacillus frigoritolerans]